MSKLDFQITNETGNLRRKNYQDFIKNVYQFTPDTLYSNAILTLTYGSFENIKKQLACIHQEIKHGGCNWIIVFGGIVEAEKSDMIQYIQREKYQNIILLEEIANLGCAGGIALGLEYVLAHKFLKVILLEDDIEILSPKMINEMFEHIQEDRVVYPQYKNQIMYQDIQDISKEHCCFHCVGYPTRIFTQSGVSDPRLFQGGDEGDLMYRITKVIQNHGYKTMTLQREVLHPNYKSNKLRLRFPYMTVRNNLRSWNSKQEWKQVCHWLVIAYGYLRSGVIQCFGGFFYAFYASLRAPIDAIFRKPSHLLNQKVLRSLRATQNHKVIHQRKKQVEIDALNQEIKHAYAIYRVYTNDAYLTKQINTANSFRNMFTYGNISTTYYGAFHPINLLGNKTYIIENVNYHSKTCDVIEIDNGNIIKRLIYISFSCIIVTIIFIIIVPLIIIKAIYTNKVMKKFNF